VFRYYKGLQYLLEAARHTSASIVIAGSGPEELALKNFARTHNLSNIHFTGRVNDEEKLALMAACKGFIFPSHLPSESFGIALLEASMMAKPMISCEIGTGTSWVNLHNETGLVVPPANPQALRDAMETLLTQPELASRFGLGARKRYEELFTGESLGRSYAALYREVAKEAPANRG
jgi:Glycosyltransferase